MLKTSHICDWFEPYDDSDPLVIVITRRSGDSDPPLFDEDLGLWDAFRTAFSDDREIKADGRLSDYVYEVACLETDITPIMKSPAYLLRAAIG